MTGEPTAADYLKYFGSEAAGQMNAILAQLQQVRAVGTPSKAALAEAASMITQLRDLAVQSAARFCTDRHDAEHYADGRRIASSVELEPGVTLDYRWFPDPADAANQPRALVERHVCRSGRVVSVVVSAPGILDVFDVGGCGG